MGLGLGVGLRFRLGLGFGLEDTVGRVRHLHQHGLAQVEVLVAHHVEDGEEDKRHVDAVEEDAWGWAECLRATNMAMAGVSVSCGGMPGHAAGRSLGCVGRGGCSILRGSKEPEG